MITLGITVKDMAMAKHSFKNEFIAIFLCFITGCLIGCIVGQFGEVADLTTDQMLERGQPISLLNGIGVAIPSGIGVAIAITAEGASAAVGVAISASLLPPIVNSGICFAFSWIQKTRNNELDGSEPLDLAIYSLSLFFLNWVLIMIFAR